MQHIGSEATVASNAAYISDDDSDDEQRGRAFQPTRTLTLTETRLLEFWSGASLFYLLRPRHSGMSGWPLQSIDWPIPTSN